MRESSNFEGCKSERRMYRGEILYIRIIALPTLPEPESEPRGAGVPKVTLSRPAYGNYLKARYE